MTVQTLLWYHTIYSLLEVCVCVCVEHGFMQQHYNRASILEALFMHWPLAVKPCSVCLIHYSKRETERENRSERRKTSP